MARPLAEFFLDDNRQSYQSRQLIQFWIYHLWWPSFTTSQVAFAETSF